MKNGKLIGGALITAGTVGIIYFGFIKKFKYGLTGLEKLMGKKPVVELENKNTSTKPVSTSEDKSVYQKDTEVVLPVSPKVPETPDAKTLSQKLDSKKGTWIKAKFNDTPVYYVINSNLYKKFAAGKDMGRVGENLNNGYHKLYDVPGTDGSSSFKISDQYLKYIFNL